MFFFHCVHLQIEAIMRDLTDSARHLGQVNVDVVNVKEVIMCPRPIPTRRIINLGSFL